RRHFREELRVFHTHAVLPQEDRSGGFDPVAGPQPEGTSFDFRGFGRPRQVFRRDLGRRPAQGFAGFRQRAFVGDERLNLADRRAAARRVFDKTCGYVFTFEFTVGARAGEFERAPSDQGPFFAYGGYDSIPVGVRRCRVERLVWARASAAADVVRGDPEVVGGFVGEARDRRRHGHRARARPRRGRARRAARPVGGGGAVFELAFVDIAFVGVDRRVQRGRGLGDRGGGRGDDRGRVDERGFERFVGGRGRGGTPWVARHDFEVVGRVGGEVAHRRRDGHEARPGPRQGGAFRRFSVA